MLGKIIATNRSSRFFEPSLGRLPLCLLVIAAALDVPALAQGPSARGQDPSAAASSPVAQDLAVVKRVELEAGGYEAATAAAKRLAGQPSGSVAQVLESMQGSSPLAKNWLRMIAADIADNDPFPRDLLLQFFTDRSQDADARHAAYQMLVTRDPELKADLLKDAADDPSLPVRHAAIAMLLDKANQSKGAGDEDGAADLFRVVVSQGRNPDQLQAAVKALGELGEKIELADELGLMRRWWVIGPFDNTASAQFDTAYLPEQVYLSDGRLPADWLEEDATVAKAIDGAAAARAHVVLSDHSFGVVSVNPAMENAKDSIAYCYVEFEVAQAVDAVARLGCITASKVWVNGKFVMANEVYHSGTRIDQYIGDCQVVAGRNSALIKICQNAQTESWAQDWQFQFRLTDRFETPVKPTAMIQPPR